MSGGVDSSVAAALLKSRAMVIGLTMCFNFAKKDGHKPNCCGVRGTGCASGLSGIGIKHYVLNLNKDFSQKVIKILSRIS